MPLRAYYRPSSWADALALLDSAAPLLIGPRPRALDALDAEAAVDLSALDLAYIREMDDGAIHIGALTTLQAIADSPALCSRASALLPVAAVEAAHPGLRQLATLAGALASPEGPPELWLALLALDATVVTRGVDGERETAIADFRPAGGALVSEARIAGWTAQAVGALERLSRTPRDQAIVAAACALVVEGGEVSRARLALADGGPPRRVSAIAPLLEGRPLDAERLAQTARFCADAAQPLSDFRASADYRRAMAGVLARRALAAAWTHAMESSR
ncbi:MAG: FAD binding domain-containing protein [Chloroflexi bacterium]|nr:FAD binding domain-containing protein [Chloroflexota bacterium]MBI3734576.1 FAD binding domain-containing protein [Chloroflexota bacterium]